MSPGSLYVWRQENTDVYLPDSETLRLPDPWTLDSFLASLRARFPRYPPVKYAREVLRVSAAPWRDRAVVQRLVGIGDDELGIDLERGTQPVALLARPIR